MAQLGQLDLQLALEGAGALGEDVEDQARAVEGAAGEEALEVALLARRQRVIDEDEVGTRGLDGRLDLLGLAAAHEQAGVGALPHTADIGDRLDARRHREGAQLLEVLALRLPVRETNVHEDRTLTPPRSLKQLLETLWQAP